VTKTQLGAANADDARRAAANDFKRYPAAQPKLLEPAHLVRRTDYLSDLGNLAAAKLSDGVHFQGKKPPNACRFDTENESQQLPRL
jgi:hypothetical protein